MIAFFIFAISFPFFLYFQSTSIYGGDAGDLVSAAFTGGIAHPPGYPLYTLIGHFLTKIPIETVAWRVSLLSSFSSAIALVFIYLIIKEVTKNKLVGILASLLLGTTYLFWLYAIVPEVFAMNSAITAILIYLVYRWSEKGRIKYAYFASFFLGLSMAHHHIIIFSFPAFAYVVLSKRKNLRNYTIGQYITFPLLFVAGLAPYGYIMWAARNNPMITWNDPTNVSNFIKLVTRASYGTFQSGSTMAHTLTSRFMQQVVIFDLTLSDFYIVGIILALVGMIALFKKNRFVFNFLLLGLLFTGPIYFFYASYILWTQFSIATLERFLLPAYLYFIVFLAFGLKTVSEFVASFPQRFSQAKPRQNLTPIIILVVGAFLIAMNLIINYPKLSILKNDRTAENFGYDLLKTPEKDAVLLLKYDAPLFTSQYVHYVLKFRPDLKLFHIDSLIVGNTKRAINERYPDITLPEMGANFEQQFIDQNFGKYPIYSNVKLNLQKYTWVPVGLVYKLYESSNLPVATDVMASNEKAWATYSDPKGGSVKKYGNLFLANIPFFYQRPRLDAGYIFANNGFPDKAEKYYKEAIALDDQTSASYFALSQVLSLKGSCDEAKNNLEVALELEPNNKELVKAMGDLYISCFKDKEQAKAWFERFDKLNDKEEGLLQEL